MGELKTPIPVVLVLAATSRHAAALVWAAQQAEAQWGPRQLQSDPFVFDQTRYYQASMGDDLRKQFFAFRELIDPGLLSTVKVQTNRWEIAYRELSRWPESRPLNLDPGYISEGKLVLASTKDHAHRVYVDQGIYAEVTLRFQAARWQTQPWTYADYQSALYHAFFDRCREYLRIRLGKAAPVSG